MTASMATASSPGARKLKDIEAVVRQNEGLLTELQRLRAENLRLRDDNEGLLARARAAQNDRQQLVAQVVTAHAARDTLQKRLDRAGADAQTLEQQLRSQAEAFVRKAKQREERAEQQRWANVTATASAAAALPPYARMQVCVT
jgi:hypothetical protein